MCNFSIGFLQEGIRIGLENRERINFEKGERIGIVKGVCKSIIIFMRKTSCSIDAALDFFDIPNAESSIYIDMINQLSTQKG